MNTRLKAWFAALTVGGLLCAPGLAAVAHAQVPSGQPTEQTGLTAQTEPSSLPPFTTPDTSDCPNRNRTPPPSDEAEIPQPGEDDPLDLPVASPPVGGSALAGCDLVLPDGAPPPPANVSAASWVVADLDTGEVLAGKDPHARHRPASIIKTLLALVVLDHLDLGATVTGTQEDADIEGSKVGVGPGGTYTNWQLLLGLVMNSGNDAANAFATQLGGVPATVALMNERAHALGAFDTRAATPSGLDGPGGSSSAYDMALIFSAAMRNPAFRDAAATILTDFPGYPANPDVPGDWDRPGFAMANDNLLLQLYEGAIGGKTGYTDNARHTFIGAAERDGRRLVTVLLRGEIDHFPLWQQAADLLDYGFALPRDAAVGTLVTAAEAADIAAAMTQEPTGSTALLQAGGNGDSGPGGEALSPLTVAALAGGGVLVVALFVASYRISRNNPRKLG